MLHKLLDSLLEKSFLTNLLSALLALAGFLVPGEAGALLLTTGLYALSGAFTNWMAIYMLFERVPGLYGSGVIPARFEEFKVGIRELVMEQFFNPDNIRQFFSQAASAENGLRTLVDDIVARVDLNKAFDALVDVIMQSSFSTMLSMIGGAKRLEGLREPFVKRMQAYLAEVGSDKEFLAQLANHSSQLLLARVESIVEKRLNELTPQLVKEIMQQMIRKHLGWLVVWGGVFGALMGFVVELVL